MTRVESGVLARRWPLPQASDQSGSVVAPPSTMPANAWPAMSQLSSSSRPPIVPTQTPVAHQEPSTSWQPPSIARSTRLRDALNKSPAQFENLRSYMGKRAPFRQMPANWKFFYVLDTLTGPPLVVCPPHGSIDSMHREAIEYHAYVHRINLFEQQCRLRRQFCQMPFEVYRERLRTEIVTERKEGRKNLGSEFYFIPALQVLPSKDLANGMQPQQSNMAEGRWHEVFYFRMKTVEEMRSVTPHAQIPSDLPFLISERLPDGTMCTWEAFPSRREAFELNAAETGFNLVRWQMRMRIALMNGNVNDQQRKHLQSEMRYLRQIAEYRVVNGLEESRKRLSRERFPFPQIPPDHVFFVRRRGSNGQRLIREATPAEREMVECQARDDGENLVWLQKLLREEWEREQRTTDDMRRQLLSAAYERNVDQATTRRNRQLPQVQASEGSVQKKNERKRRRKENTQAAPELAVPFNAIESDPEPMPQLIYTDTGFSSSTNETTTPSFPHIPPTTEEKLNEIDTNLLTKENESSGCFPWNETSNEEYLDQVQQYLFSDGDCLPQSEEGFEENEQDWKDDENVSSQWMSMPIEEEQEENQEYFLNNVTSDN